MLIPYTKVKVRTDVAASTDPIESSAVDVPQGIKVLSAYVVNKSNAVGTSIVFGLKSGSLYIPMKVAGATAAGVPVMIDTPFNMAKDEKLYAIMTTPTAADTIVFVIFGEFSETISRHQL